MPEIRLDVTTCEYCIKKNSGRPSDAPCQKAAQLPAPGLVVVPNTLITAQCPCSASWEDLRRAANRLPNATGLSDWAVKLLPAVKSARNPVDAGYLAGTGINNSHTFVTPERRLVVWVRQLPDAQAAERFRQWFLGNGLAKPVAQMSTAEKLAASAWMSFEEMPAQGAEVVRQLIASIPILVAVLAAIALSPAKYVRFFQCLFYGAGIVMQVKDYFESFAGWLAYSVNATSPSELRTAAKHLAKFAMMAVRDLSLAGIERMISYLRSCQGNGAKLKSDAENGGYSDASAKPQAQTGAPPQAQPVSSGGSKKGLPSTMPVKIKARDPGTGKEPFSDFPEFANKSISKDLYPWLQSRFTKLKSGKLDADGYIDSKGGSEIWARRIPGTNTVECVRVDMVAAKGGAGHNVKFTDGPVVRTAPRSQAKFAGDDPAGHYGRMVTGEGPAQGTSLSTERIGAGKVGHIHKEAIRMDQLETYLNEYVPSAKAVADWGAPVPRSAPKTMADGSKNFSGQGATNYAAHIRMKP